MTHKAETPLVAKLQTAPDAAWGPILDQIAYARSSYDPVTQTAGHPLLNGESPTYRASSSGGTPALSAETDDAKDAPLAPVNPSPEVARTYRASSSGGTPALSAETDGSDKQVPTPVVPDPQEVRTLRGIASGGYAKTDDDGGKH